MRATGKKCIRYFGKLYYQPSREDVKEVVLKRFYQLVVYDDHSKQLIAATPEIESKFLTNGMVAGYTISYSEGDGFNIANIDLSKMASLFEEVKREHGDYDRYLLTYTLNRHNYPTLFRIVGQRKLTEGEYMDKLAQWNTIVEHVESDKKDKKDKANLKKNLLAKLTKEEQEILGVKS